MTAEEGVALILQHPEIFKDHYYMDLPGLATAATRSRSCGSRGGPKLHWAASHSGAEWGSASCGNVGGKHKMTAKRTIS